MSSLLNTYLSVVRKLIPKEAPLPAVGLDVGVDSCKLVELEKTENSFTILNWGVEPIENADVMGSVTKLFKRLDLDIKTARTAVFGKGTLIRFIEMPRMPLADLRKSFDLEADKYFPFARDQIYTDIHILDPKGKEKQISVLVAAAKREIINDRIQLLNNLGMTADFVGINALAIANVFSALPQDSQDSAKKESSSGVIAVLDIGENVSNLVIIVDGLPRFTRDIFVGGQDLTKRISHALTISPQDAQKLKCQPGDRAQEVLNICDSVLLNLISETKLSFDYFTTERNIPISKLFLTGGSSMLEGIKDFFAKNLDVKVEGWNPFSSLKALEGVSMEEIHKNSGLLGIALGLALSQYD